MATVNDILAYLETLAPRSMKMDWDNVGLLCGSRKTEVTKILVALDPFEGVCLEAAAWGAELIVTHHPLIFQALKSITDETSIGRSIQLLCREGISAINAHTNLDCAPGGVNDRLAAALGLKEIQDTIAKIDPLPGAKEFLDELRATTQVVILSDTFEQFAKPLMEKLGWPTIFCNTLEVAESGEITGFKMRCEQSKLTTVKGLQSIGYETIAAGDSYNDLGMILNSKAGFLFRSVDQRFILLALGHQLLHPVLAAAVHAPGDGLPDGVGAVHLGGGAELDECRITAAGKGGLVHLRPDPGNIFSDGHDLSPFVQTKM